MAGGSSLAVPQVSFLELEEDIIRLARNILQIRDLSPELCLNFVQTASIDWDFIRNWTVILQPYVAGGIPEDEDGRQEWRAAREAWRQLQPLEFTAFCQKNHQNPGVFLNLRAVLVDRKTTRWWTVEEATHVAQMLESGKFALITGPPGFGKTDLFFTVCRIACNLFEEHQRVGPGSKLEVVCREIRLEAEREKRQSRDIITEEFEAETSEAEAADADASWAPLNMIGAKEFTIVSNIPTGKGAYSPHFAYQTTLSGTLQNIAEIRLRGGFAWWGLDELAMNVDKFTRGKTEVKNVEAAWRTVRKSGAGVWFISQDDSDLAITFRKWCQTQIWKRGKRQALVHVDGVHELLMLRKIPSCRASIPFNTESRGGFDIDVNTPELNRIIGEVEKQVGYDDPVATNRKINEAIIAFCREERLRVQKERAFEKLPRSSQRTSADGQD